MDRQDWPEWCVRQRVPGGRACVWVLAPSAAAAAVIANHLCGPMGGWRVGPDIKLDVFLRSKYAERCDAGDFTRMVIDRPVRHAWLDKALPAPPEFATPPGSGHAAPHRLTRARITPHERTPYGTRPMSNNTTGSPLGSEHIPSLQEMGVKPEQCGVGHPHIDARILDSCRLIEMRRVLKPNGSIFLHCDPTAGHYLKAMLDAVFGAERFHNEIVWRRTRGLSDARRFGRVHDTILYYAGPAATWNPVYLKHDPDYIRRAYRHRDPKLGPWIAADLTGSGPGTGESGQPWRDIDPSTHGRHWSTPIKGDMHDFVINERLIDGWPDAYPGVHARLDALDAAGLVYWPEKEDGRPRLKRFLASTKGNALDGVITDIKRLEHQSNERVG